MAWLRPAEKVTAWAWGRPGRLPVMQNVGQRSQELGVGSQEPEVGSWEPGMGSRVSAYRHPTPDSRLLTVDS
jgi:hypothetical protein